MRPRRTRRGVTARSPAASIWVAGGVGLLVASLEMTRRQASVARAVIGKPLGDRPPAADRTYKKKYGDPIDLLLLGDSIAAGLGADGAKHTLGAQLAQRLAKGTRRAVRLRTAAHVGSETAMLRAQLAGLPAGYRADVAVIIVGGNDVTHRIRVAESRRHLREAITHLRDHRTAVVVGTCPDLGALMAVPQPLRAMGRLASRQLAVAQREVTTELGGIAVNLAEVVGPFFLAQPDQMFSIDRFHPSSAGYKRTAKAILPGVLVALGISDHLPHGHVGPHTAEPWDRSGA